MTPPAAYLALHRASDGKPHIGTFVTEAFLEACGVNPWASYSGSRILCEHARLLEWLRQEGVEIDPEEVYCFGPPGVMAGFLGANERTHVEGGGDPLKGPPVGFLS
ncbi:MAG: hypothetical protein AB7F35_00710 [Acetobacteraceae bacterium]